MLARLFDGAAFLALLAALAFAPLALGSAYPWSELGLSLLVSTSLLCAAVALALGAPLARPPLLPAVALGAYLLLAAVSALVNPDLHGSLRSLRGTLVALLGFVLAVSLVRGPRRQTQFVTVAFATAFLMAGYGLLQYLGHGVTPTLGPRVSSTFFNPNHYAGFLDLMTPLALGVALFTRSLPLRLLSGTLAALLLLNVLLTFSRGGWVAVAVASIVLLAAWWWSGACSGTLLRRTLALLLTVVALVGLAWAADRVAPDVTERLLTRLERLERDLTNLDTFDRVVILRAGAQVVREAPWLGMGPGGFVHAVTAHRPEQIVERGDAMLHRFVNYAHNDYLQVASETGLPSLLMFGLFWLLVFVSRSTCPTPVRAGLLAGLVALLVHGLVDGNLTVITANALWAYAAAGVLLARQVPVATVRR